MEKICGKRSGTIIYIYDDFTYNKDLVIRIFCDIISQSSIQNVPALLKLIKMARYIYSKIILVFI